MYHFNIGFLKLRIFSKLCCYVVPVLKRTRLQNTLNYLNQGGVDEDEEMWKLDKVLLMVFNEVYCLFNFFFMEHPYE